MNPPPRKAPGIQIITPTDGLYSPGSLVTLRDLERFATVAIDAEDSRYRYPLERDATKIAERIGPKCEVVLLGSVASGKYVDVLLPIFGKRLVFPREFIGHGDMARGGLLLQRAASREELSYMPVADPARLGASASKKARAEVAARYVRGFRRVLERTERTVLVVAHGLPLRYTLLALKELDPTPIVEQVPLAEPYRLRRDELEGAVERLDRWSRTPVWAEARPGFGSQGPG